MTAAASASILAANPGPAAHLALLGVIVLIALAVVGITRWRRRREASTPDEIGRNALAAAAIRPDDQPVPPVAHQQPDQHSRDQPPHSD